ncbi:Nucleoporin nup35 [Mactra antiquata]
MTSPDIIGHHTSEPMSMGTPTSPLSPVSGHQSQYLPSYLLGDSMSHSVSPMSSRLWSGSGSPPRSSRMGTVTSPNNSGIQITGTPRFDNSLRTKDKAGAPPTRSLLQSSSPVQTGVASPYNTHSQYSVRTAGLSTPAPPTSGLSQSLHDTTYMTPDQSVCNISRIPTSPAQLDPFYTQGESLTTDDTLDDTWITVFGFPPVAASYVLQQFSLYGNIIRHVIASEGNWMHLHYQSKIQAKKALSKNGKVLGNNIMVGVSNCIDKKVMDYDKENESANVSCQTFSTPISHTASSGNSSQLKHTPMRPLTAAYMAARSENEVIPNSQAPKKNSGVVSKMMEYMFGW